MTVRRAEVKANVGVRSDAAASSMSSSSGRFLGKARHQQTAPTARELDRPSAIPASLCQARDASAMPLQHSDAGFQVILHRPAALGSPASHNYGNVSAAGASRLAALLVGQILPVFSSSRLAIRAPGARYVTVIGRRSDQRHGLIEALTANRADKPLDIGGL